MIFLQKKLFFISEEPRPTARSSSEINGFFFLKKKSIYLFTVFIFKVSK